MALRGVCSRRERSMGCGASKKSEAEHVQTNEKRRRLSVGEAPKETVADREDKSGRKIQVDRMDEIFAMFPNTEGGRRYSLAG